MWVVPMTQIQMLDGRSTDVQVVVGEIKTSPELRKWVAERIQEALGAAFQTIASVAVVLSPMPETDTRPGGLIRCSVVLKTSQGRRVVETRDRRLVAAFDRALRLVELSVVQSPPKPTPPFERWGPLV